ncbi:carbohydrate ABC transporter permease [uncultured Brachyspira sp.]|uniref:carbohydrate ABC transporter permease n=1 Tax=uncultured Brachyspira sp. TaxID=221953 RepID=UPI0025F1CDE6|nr:carbohydrate ABC transporter permease [uncultured Brachyspira sp.]
MNKKNIILIKRILFFICVLPLALLFIFPMIWMFVSSIKPEAQIFEDLSSIKAFLPPLTPINQWFNNYIELNERFNMVGYLLNSLKYSLIAMFISCLLNSLAGYSLSRMKMPFKNVIMSFIIATMIIPTETTMVPLYLIVRGLKGVNTTFGYIFPFIVSAMNIFLFRQFFISLPKELEEAAKIDGTNAIQTYFLVILPNCKSAFATVAIFSFIGVWNDFLWAIMVFSDVDKQTVQVGLQSFMSVNPVYTGQVMAALTIITIPMVIIYSVCQKYIVKGIAHVSAKG